MTKFSLTYDKDYGVYKRKGWTTCIDGAVIVELERWLAIVLFRTFFRYLKGRN